MTIQLLGQKETKRFSFWVSSVKKQSGFLHGGGGIWGCSGIRALSPSHLPSRSEAAGAG